MSYLFLQQKGHKRKRPGSKPATPAPKKTAAQESLKSFASTPSTPTTSKPPSQTTPKPPVASGSFTPTVSDRTKSKLSGFAAIETVCVWKLGSLEFPEIGVQFLTPF